MSDGDCLQQELWAFLSALFITEIKHISSVSTGRPGKGIGEKLHEELNLINGKAQ